MNAGRTVMLLAVSTTAWLPPPAAAEAPRRPVQVTLRNDGLAPPDVAGRAQAEATRLYSLIGVELVWVSAATDDVAVRTVKLTTWEPRGDRVPAMALGVTYPPEGATEARAYVFWLRVQRYAQQFSLGIDKLLGAAIAHELGHMLLPRGSHASRGLMRGTWDREQFRAAASGLLQFSPQSAAHIRRSVNSALASSDPKTPLRQEH